eukprot:3801607-Amphidinium_carterae.1
MACLSKMLDRLVTPTRMTCNHRGGDRSDNNGAESLPLNPTTTLSQSLQLFCHKSFSKLRGQPCTSIGSACETSW